jgi:hypothetical protein
MAESHSPTQTASPAAAAPATNGESPQEQAAIQSAFTAAGQVPSVGPSGTAAGPGQATASQLAFSQDQHAAPPGSPSQHRDAASRAAALLLAQQLANGIERSHPAAGPDLEVADGVERNTRKQRTEEVSPDITAQRGIRPRKYRSYLDAPRNNAEVAYARVLPQVTAYINQQLAASGMTFRVTQAEIAANFLSEGGNLLLDMGATEHIDGYGYAGIDTIRDRAEQVRPYLHPSVAAIMDDPAHWSNPQNEQGQGVHSLTDLTLEQTAYANASMYASAMTIVEHDLTARGVDLRTLPPAARIFWASLYYNLGEGRFAAGDKPATGGRKYLALHGYQWYAQKYTGHDSVAAGMGAQHNAALRLANEQLINTDLDGNTGGATDGVGLPTAEVRMVNVPLSSLLESTDVLARDVRDIAMGDGPITGGCVGETIAVVDTITRQQPTLPPDMMAVLQTRRDFAAMVAGYRQAILAQLESVPNVAGMTLKQINPLLRSHNHGDTADYLVEQMQIAASMEDTSQVRLRDSAATAGPTRAN